MGDKKILESYGIWEPFLILLTDRNGSLTEWIIVMIADVSNWKDCFKAAASSRKRNRIYKTYKATFTFHFASI